MLAAAVGILFLAVTGDPLAQRLLSFPPLRSETPASAVVATPRAQQQSLTGDETIDQLENLSVTHSKLITPAVRLRVAQRLTNEPEILSSATGLLPDTPEAAEAAWAAFGKIAPDERMDPRYEHAREWLRRHGYLRNELLAAVKNVHDDEGFIAGEDDLEAYARLDWTNAEPLLRRLAAGDAPRTAALAHALLYRYGESKTKERSILLSIAENRKAPARARDIAIDALMRDEWPGRDNWYFAQYEDATLGSARDGVFGLSPLGNPVVADPDTWIPRIAPLAGSPNKTVRTNAAAILGEFNLDQARADALRPLLPWLSNPSWIDDAGMLRLRLVQTVARLGFREAIPSLQSICRDDKDETVRAYAANSLLEFHAPAAMTCARAILEHSKGFAGRGELEETIARSGELSDEEIAQVVEAYAAEISTPARERKFFESFVGENSNWRATLGMRFAQSLPPHEHLAELLMVAASESGDAATAVGLIVATMNTASVQRWIASRLPTLTPDEAAIVVSLLQHRVDAAKHASAELRAVLAGTGAPRGIAAITLSDPSAIREILEKGSPESRQGLFAAARLVNEPMKTSDVVAASKGAESAAAEMLVAMNTSESRAALAALRPGEAVIWGIRPWSDPGHATFNYFDEWETKLRALAKKRTYDRIYALAVASYWGGNREVVRLAERGDSLLLLRDDAATPVSPATAARVRTLLAEVKPDDLEFYDNGAYDGPQLEFVSVTADGGHRVFMNNPPFDKQDRYGRLVRELSDLFDSKK